MRSTMGGRAPLLLAALLCCCCCARQAVVAAQQQPAQQQQQPSRSAVSVVVSNGYEFHSSLTSTSVTFILVATNITFSHDTCPYPASPQFPATILDRDVAIASLSPAAAAAAGVALDPRTAALASQAETRGPFFIDCSHLDARFQLMPGRTLTWHSVVLRNCRTLSTAGFVLKHAGATLVLNNTVEDQGSVCLPLSATQGVTAALPRVPTTLLPPPPAAQQQATSLAPALAGWCSAAARGGRLPLPQALLPTLLLGGASNHSICQEPALLLGSTAWLETPTPINASSSKASAEQQQPEDKPEAFTMLAVRSALLCPQPVSVDCLRTNGTDACLAAAFARVNPDAQQACPAFDGFALHTCLTDPSVSRIMLLATARMNQTTCPPSLSEDPYVLNRSVTIMSDPRGPRMVLDCGLLTDRVQLPPGQTLTLNHLLLANCSIGSEKPVSIVRLDAGSQLVLVDTLLLQPPNLCLPLQEQVSAVLHAPRPASVPGVQAVSLGQPQEWCARQPGTRSVVDSKGNATGSAAAAAPAAPSEDDQAVSRPISGNSSYSATDLPPLPQVYAARTGLGPSTAATLDQPAAEPFFAHPTWPGYVLCSQQALLLRNYAYDEPFGWTLPPNLSRPALLSALASSNATPSTPLASQLGPGYNGSLPVRYVNSAWLCAEPNAACAAEASVPGRQACLIAEYARINPDVVAAAAAAQADPGAGVGGSSHGINVVLPAVLAAVGGALLLGLLGCLLAARHRRKQLASARARLAASKDPHTANGNARSGGVMGWLAGPHSSAASSGNPMQRLLGIHTTSPPASGSDGAAASSGARSLLASASPDGITLSMLLGAGSFGRVYAGVWNGARVAVKVISHSAEDDTRISSELSLSLSFDHPNLVRALHYARLRINPNSPEATLGTPSTGSGSLFLPEGAVGVFDLPSTWAVIQRQGQGPAPMIDTETWIVMDLMDRGNLAAAIRQGAFIDPATGGLRAASLVRRCADIAAGLSYLHARNVCHGDLKLDNVLLRTEPQDPDGLMAAVADFGLSRALAFGQSHLSTRRYGTITHMPPELLVAGKLTPAADIYSFGIMMWELVARSAPFAGLHHGEIIHRVVTQDLRPGPWTPAASASLPLDYITLAEACWSRQAGARPSASEVLQRLVVMLTAVEGVAGHQA